MSDRFDEKARDIISRLDCRMDECGYLSLASQELAAALRAENAKANEDTARLDWLESHPESPEPKPMSFWSQHRQRWMWKWIDLKFLTLREAIDAARKAKA